MKLRKLFLAAGLALVTAGVSAQTNIEDIRIYINPGHGSWGPNNRHMATIGHSPISTEDPDTTDFFESNTNLWKCLEIFHTLKGYGFKHDGVNNALDLTQNLVMSRIGNGPYPYSNVKDETLGYIPDDQNNAYNRRLSEIAAEVEANNFDMFISVHSNAATEGGTTNYLYFAYRTSGGADAETCVRMSMAGWNHRILDRHTQWSHYDYTLSESDYSAVLAGSKGKIGTQVLGVLNHSVSGYLVEGYFHTYQPARHRGMNIDVDHLEGLDYARGVADYYGVEKESVGQIYGIVRDAHQKFTDDLYAPKAGTPDVYKPLNGVEVTLKQGETTVATYTTDVNYNGAFVFRNIQPGEYTVEFSHADYKADTTYTWNVDRPTKENAPIVVTVEAAKTAYPIAFIENKSYVPPTVTYVNYPDSTAGKEGFELLTSYETKGTAYDLLAEQLTGKVVRRQILRDDRLYVLALDTANANAPHVYLADLAENTVDTLGTTAAEGDIYKLSDIALTADGYLVGINKTSQAYNGTANVKGYKWEKNESGVPAGELSVWWTNGFAGNWTNGIAGEAMIYSGTLDDGKMIYTGTTAASSGNTRLVVCAISEGSYIGYMRNNQDGTYIATTYLGETFEMTLSPRADDQIIFNSAKINPFEIQLNPTDTQVPTILAHLGEGMLNTASIGESYFKYAGRDLMVATDVADGNAQGIKMFDVTDGLDAAKEITLEGATIEPVEYNYVSAHGELALTLSTDERTTGANIELFLAVDGKATKFSVGDFYESVNLAKNAITGTANPFAYALKSEIADNTLKISYSLNIDATDVNIYVMNAEGEEVATSAEGAKAKGSYTAEISIADFEDGDYTWEIEVAGAEKANIERFSTWSFYHPCGLDIDNNPENASFGTVFVCEGYNRGKTTGYVSAQADGSYGGGLYIFDAAGNQVLNKDGAARFYPSSLTNQDRTFAATTSKTCGADFAKVAIAEDGRIFVNRYNFDGNYYLYAESLEKLVADGEFTSLLADKTMTTGIYYDESGNYLAGPAQSFDVIGSGENLKLLALSRLDNTVDATFDENRVVEYNLGTASVLPAPTSYAALDQKYTISYDRKANLQYDNRGGVWYIQYRGAPSATQPALIYVDENGVIQYFEGDGGKARYQGAISVSPDGNRLVASSASGIVSVYKVVRAESGKVTLNEEYRLTHNMGGSAYSAAWDAAGNFYLGNASNEVVQGYALPRSEAFTTKAAAKYGFTVGTSSISDIEAEDADVAPVYYNLQGVQVENPSNGVYIVKRGNKVTKEYIK